MQAENIKENFLITGAVGYVGSLLLEKLLFDMEYKDKVGKIIFIDKESLDTNLNLKEKIYKFILGENGEEKKVFFINKNLVENWQEEVLNIEKENNFKITKVVHLAWQIRTLYAKKKLQNHWNIDGSKKVFEFVKNNQSIKTFVHFSTVASYGALPTNTFQTIFTEDQPFKKTNYLYAEEKRIVEEELDKISFANKNIFVIRPASITGQKGRERTGFGLQSALSGKIASQNLLFKLISKILQFMPATTGWARQFIHEDDIVNAVIVMSFSDVINNNIEKYNLCPSGGYIDAKEMGELLNKKVIFLHPQIVRVLCFFAWHLTFGKIPTSPGVWKAYSYPIIVDGTKITKDFPNFKYLKSVRGAYKS